MNSLRGSNAFDPASPERARCSLSVHRAAILCMRPEAARARRCTNPKGNRPTATVARARRHDCEPPAWLGRWGERRPMRRRVEDEDRGRWLDHGTRKPMLVWGWDDRGPREQSKEDDTTTTQPAVQLTPAHLRDGDRAEDLNEAKPQQQLLHRAIRARHVVRLRRRHLRGARTRTTSVPESVKADAPPDVGISRV